MFQFPGFPTYSYVSLHADRGFLCRVSPFRYLRIIALPTPTARELALRIKDNAPETMVTVVTMAPSYAENALRDAIAAGADRAVLICDSALAGSDTLVTANILAAAINRLGGFDLVLCGRKAIDSETGHIAPQLSERLGLPMAAAVTAFGIDGDTLRICCTKRRRFGRIRRCRSGSALCLQRNGYGAQPDRHGHAPKQKSRHRAPYACRHRDFRRKRRPARLADTHSGGRDHELQKRQKMCLHRCGRRRAGAH